MEEQQKKDKYYTPTIEEFHVGFEYEYFTKDWIEENGTREYKYTWCKYEYNIGEDYGVDISNTEYHIKTNQVRVKYLDKSDIESLGWEDWRDMGMSCFRYNHKDPNNEFQIYDQFDNQFTQIYNYDSKIVFQGTIKNKSELRVLMKQLGINETK